MKKNIILLIIFTFLFANSVVFAAQRYGALLCQSPDFKCVKVKGGSSWEKMFPDPEKRDLVKRINRMNTHLHPGMVIAVPENLSQVTIYDVSPFPRYIESTGEKTIYVSQKDLAWAAYDANGELVWWGPISSGRDWCEDIQDSCTTPSGDFRMIRKQGIDCISTIYPKRANGDDGGAPMPFCMHFYGGFALHGAPVVPGFRDSHGCVRLFIEDAKWLNEKFIDVPQGNGSLGTRVIIGPVS